MRMDRATRRSASAQYPATGAGCLYWLTSRRSGPVTLVVAGIHDGGISMVADTKITYDDDPARTLQVFTEALPKLVIVTDDLAVGYAGVGPRFLLDQVVSVRDLPLAELLAHLQT